MRDALPPLFCPLQPLFSPPVASIFADVHFHTFAATAAICAVFALCRFPLLFTLCRSVPFFVVPLLSPFAFFRSDFRRFLFSPLCAAPKICRFFYLFNHLQRRKLCGEICDIYPLKNDAIILICNVLCFAENPRKSAKKTLKN